MPRVNLSHFEAAVLFSLLASVVLGITTKKTTRERLNYGAYCFGCCWALFAVLVATGVMSLAWMLLLTLVVFVEKMLPQGRRAGAATGIALIGLVDRRLIAHIALTSASLKEALAGL